MQSSDEYRFSLPLALARGMIRIRGARCDFANSGDALVDRYRDAVGPSFVTSSDVSYRRIGQLQDLRSQPGPGSLRQVRRSIEPEERQFPATCRLVPPPQCTMGRKTNAQVYPARSQLIRWNRRGKALLQVRWR